MLSPIEKMLFILLALLSVGAAYNGFMDVYRIINQGQGELDFNLKRFLGQLWQRIRQPRPQTGDSADDDTPAPALDQQAGNLVSRAWNALVIYLSQRTTLKTRRITSLLHWGVVLGFTFYFLVNALDVLLGYIPNFEETLASTGLLYDGYRLAADVLSVVVLVGVAYFIVRRLFLPNKQELTYHENVMLHPKVKKGGQVNDSLIVAFFILIHVGARFMGEAAYVALHEPDAFMPLATIVSGLLVSFDESGLMFMRHAMWWLALGGILLFLPYFPYSKHLHLMMAPLNYMSRPERTSLGELPALDFEDEEIEQFGVNTLFDLPKTGIFDAFACIQCNRCQDVCPAYTTGKELSPSALEVNKRYYINENFGSLAAGEVPEWSLMGSVISESAVWACTSCGACTDICPVGNEPMHDILEIRRDAVLMQAEFPGELAEAFNGMERQGNPWGLASSRMDWAEGLNVPTVEENPDFDVLYWTGCAVSYDDRAQKTARALVTVLERAGVNFAVLGEMESCTGDVARRAGNEYLYFEMALGNVETLNEVAPKRIVATCPHCLHNLGKEYHQFGGNYEVIHHTELIEELIQEGKLPRNASPDAWSNVTFHDPCYLGRHNDIVDAPRNVLDAIGADSIEMPRHGKQSFCCGAGGAQFWKEEEHGDKAVNLERYEEAIETGAETLAVGCPFCMQMFETARSEKPDGPVVKDIVEMIAEKLPADSPETEPAAD